MPLFGSRPDQWGDVPRDERRNHPSGMTPGMAVEAHFELIRFLGQTSLVGLALLGVERRLQSSPLDMNHRPRA